MQIERLRKQCQLIEDLPVQKDREISIPSEIVCYIFQYLRVIEFRHTSLVSRMWHQCTHITMLSGNYQPGALNLQQVYDKQFFAPNFNYRIKYINYISSLIIFNKSNYNYGGMLIRLLSSINEISVLLKILSKCVDEPGLFEHAIRSFQQKQDSIVEIFKFINSKNYTATIRLQVMRYLGAYLPEIFKERFNDIQAEIKNAEGLNNFQKIGIFEKLKDKIKSNYNDIINYLILNKLIELIALENPRFFDRLFYSIVSYSPKEVINLFMNSPETLNLYLKTLSLSNLLVYFKSIPSIPAKKLILNAMNNGNFLLENLRKPMSQKFDEIDSLIKLKMKSAIDLFKSIDTALLVDQQYQLYHTLKSQILEMEIQLNKRELLSELNFIESNSTDVIAMQTDAEAMEIDDWQETGAQNRPGI